MLYPFFGYQKINYVKLFLDQEFGLFNDTGFYFWLKIVYEFVNKNNKEYKYLYNQLLRQSQGISDENISDILN